MFSQNFQDYLRRSRTSQIERNTFSVDFLHPVDSGTCGGDRSAEPVQPMGIRSPVGFTGIAPAKIFAGRCVTSVFANCASSPSEWRC
jgi:hypothetical protein